MFSEPGGRRQNETPAKPVGTYFNRVIGLPGDNYLSVTDAQKLRLAYGSVRGGEAKQ